MKPLLKWAGGKRWLIPHIKPLWERAEQDGAHHLVEPFAGGAAIAFGLEPEHVCLNDLNPHLMNFYWWVKQGMEDIRDEEVPLGRDEYNRARQSFNRGSSSHHFTNGELAARLFYVLNRTCYNGLWRVNASGLFNVPWGKYKSPRYVKSFAPYHDLMSKWALRTGPFHKFPLLSSDFVYADPPYDAGFTNYTSNGFAWDDQVHVAEYLAKHSGPVALSNKATPRIVELYTDLGYSLTYLDGPRRISCKGDRKPVKEILATLNI